MSQRLPADAVALLSPGLTHFFRAPRVLAFLAGVRNASGLVFAPHAGAYFFAVVCPLLLGAVVFIRVVFVRPHV